MNWKILSFLALSHLLLPKAWASQKNLCLELLKSMSREDVDLTWALDDIERIYSELRIMNREGEKSFSKAAEAWIGKHGEMEFKAGFLLTQIGSQRGQFEHYLKLIPKAEQGKVWKAINRDTSFGTFRDLAQRSGVNAEFFDNGVLESFLFYRRFLAAGVRNSTKKFLMGESNTFSDEVRVTLTRPFEIGATPVTQLQYALVMKSNPSHFVDSGQEIVVGGKRIKVDFNRPVETVSWDDAQAFIAKLNQWQNEYVYRLPTDAEWEFAARGGTNSKYWFGNDHDDLLQHGWYDRNSDGQTQPVAELLANPFGLYDTHGNVREWVQDVYKRKLPGGINPLQDKGNGRVVRGGSWKDLAHTLRSASRDTFSPANKSNDVGFRLVRVPVGL